MTTRINTRKMIVFAASACALMFCFQARSATASAPAKTPPPPPPTCCPGTHIPKVVIEVAYRVALSLQSAF
jgi:hypothetical protein